jgi:tRNA A-37 threonylcarbamoyl transferase component Bud32
MPAVHQVALPARYRVVRHIANGGMAAVWAAEDSVLERLVAVKVLAAGYADDPAARRRFTREARAAARVSDHPNVVTVFDIGDHEDQAFIVMEHFAGGTVQDHIKRGDAVPVPLALRWLRETASALDTAHAADIVHRDVKPGNLLLDENGRLAVGDFGIASLAGETQVTQAGQVLGTAAYLSPEQARGNPATPASDRYSLAVVAYELLCGRKPFLGETPMAQARAHVELDPPTPTGPCEAAAAVLKHGLAKDPAARPPTAMAFVDELEGVLGDRAEPTRVTQVLTPQPQPREEPPRFARAAGAAGAAAAGAEWTPAEARAPRRAGPPPDPVARTRSPHRRAWLLAALAGACVVVGAGAALIGDDGTGGSREPAAPKGTASKAQGNPKPTESSKAASGAETTAKTTTPETAAAPATSTPSGTTSTPAAPAGDGRSAAQINNTGFAMLPGDPQGALPLLQRAVEMFRADGATSGTDYAYSLYNLGWALRLAGRPAEAIPYLEERLRVSDYKRGVVEQELRTAQAAAGQAPAAETSAKKAGGKKAKTPKD